ncbi:MAG: hypothetical protein ACK5MT_12095 [Actinomycetales bacterium]
MRPAGRSAGGQVLDLLLLRWSMLGTPAKIGAAMAVAVSLAAWPASFALGAAVEPQVRDYHVDELLPGSYVVLCIGLVVASLASSGGREIFPRQQLTAYPVSPAAEHLGALALTGANLAWWIQALGLMFTTGTATAAQLRVSPNPGDFQIAALVAAGVTLAWILTCTGLAQGLAWSAELLRSLRGGVWLLRLLFVAVAFVAIRSANATTLTRLLDWRAPRVLTDAALAACDGVLGPGLLVIAILTGCAGLLVFLGALEYRVLMRRPPRDQTRSETRVRTARPLLRADAWASDLRVWRRHDWAALWRSLPLRRGVIVLALVPAVGGLLARVGVNHIALVGGVVAAGAGLVVGVNAFALDAEGAPWRESLPVSPRVWVLARLWMLTELVVGLTVVATICTFVSARGTLHLTAALAAGLGVITASAQVVARCLRWSVLAPEYAELRTSRDSPVGPGKLVGYSANLVGVTVLLGIVLSVSAQIGIPALTVLVCLPPLLFAGLSVRRSVLAFDDHVVRGHVVQAVSRG